jgi:hypothetical protein
VIDNLQHVIGLEAVARRMVDGLAVMVMVVDGCVMMEHHADASERAQRDVV